MTEAKAREKFSESGQYYYKQVELLFHSITHEDEQVMIKLVLDDNTNKVLGAHMVGEYAAEIIQSLEVTLSKGVTKQNFDTTLDIHPTTGEKFLFQSL